ncbi:TrmH family RNA methyltransferase [Nocardioides sp.]|uniref:TrmH family RNA methyltransferase n=1 Tax=Nocardioides sp. TaxID=35761 RepID=UPI002BFFD351|nr:TrmH family RNA methyltransferase [Nocardioides sp.]HXH81061.1 TrmH family RNA methyltransferase [Nocardioides sp.]
MNGPGSASASTGVTTYEKTMEMPRRVCFLFGQEGHGLSETAGEACDGTFSIAQLGSTRSINAIPAGLGQRRVCE